MAKHGVYETILAPVITEKSTRAQEEENVYTFIVAEEASKPEIRKAVETIWDVKVLDVRTMRYAGKARRSILGQMAQNWNVGRRPDFKKAVIKLAEGDYIELYELG